MFSITTSLVVAFALAVTYKLIITVYRLCLHPLAAYPGPLLAKVTYKYEFYYDGIIGGQYVNRIAELHEQYGPIIRINPDELHISDSSFIDTIYSGPSAKSDKFAYQTAQFGNDLSVFGAISHERHRLLRGSLNRFFSRPSVAKLQPLIAKSINQLCTQFEANADTGKPVDVCKAYSCFTTDVVCEWAFANSMNLLQNPTFEPNLQPALRAGLGAAAAIKQWPVLYTILDSLPDYIVGLLMPDMPIWLNFQRSMKTEIQQIIDQESVHERKASYGVDENGLPIAPTLFHELLISDLPAQEKGVKRMAQEANVVISAGSETTAWTLSVLTFYLLDDRTCLAKLQKELKTLVHDPMTLPSLAALEQLPYLYAVIQEGLRLSYGVGTRVARCARQPIVYKDAGSGKDWEIPTGTPVSMTSVLIHHDESIFPDARAFHPERWLDGTERSRVKKLDQYLFSFSRGSRQCVGMHVAYAELYLLLPALALRLFDRMELFETTKEQHVQWHHENVTPVPEKQDEGIRVRIRRAH
ncbi:hypothetical protein CERZMDRAFT_99390 [Cercospora zeae-maydis SCOH1-5]|uniref:Cytochrome P450 n=1 Tax=Cercospora zeae-maydis SCOH1-5 TaxID=717836 RepID=A0A6A6FAG1_9PEZI|nr:hypothetical protein CERZMDRAFT_99390 [Cercospora zeae-maydis SCOH1-5]